MKKSSTVYIGMEVCKASTEIALADAGAPVEVHQYLKVSGDLASLDRAIRKLALGKNVNCGVRRLRSQAWSTA